MSQFEFDECLTINSTSIISFYWRAKLKNKLEEFFEAVEDLDKSISLFNSSSNLKNYDEEKEFEIKKCMLLRAFSNLELNRNDKAKEDFNEILKAGPDPECFYGLSKISNNFIQSLEYLNKAIKHSNNDLEKSKYLKSRGKINQSLDNNDQAIEDFSLSYELNKKILKV